ATERVVRLLTLADRDVDAVGIRWPRPLAVTEPVLTAADLDHAQRLHDGVVEALGGADVGDGDGNVVEHVTKPTPLVIASHPVGAKRRGMKGPAKQPSFARRDKKAGLLRRLRSSQ